MKTIRMKNKLIIEDIPEDLVEILLEEIEETRKLYENAKKFYTRTTL